MNYDSKHLRVPAQMVTLPDRRPSPAIPSYRPGSRRPLEPRRQNTHLIRDETHKQKCKLSSPPLVASGKQKLPSTTTVVSGSPMKKKSAKVVAWGRRRDHNHNRVEGDDQRIIKHTSDNSDNKTGSSGTSKSTQAPQPRAIKSRSSVKAPPENCRSSVRGIVSPVVH